MLLVSRLAKLRRNARLLLLATYRSSASDRGEFAFFLGELRPNPAVTELKVEGLDEDALFSVLQAAAGHPLGHEGRAVAAYLHDETDGNPFFVAELVRHFVETGVIAADDRGVWRARADLATVKVPGTVRAVLRARVGRLSDETQRLLELASVVGREFDPVLLASVLERNELGVLSDIESAARASLVRELSVGHFEFTHALVQHTLYDELGNTRRSLHHRQLALALQSQDGVPAAVVANHWVETRRENRAEVVAWARRAGDEAIAALAPDDAIRWYGVALNSTPKESRDRLELLIALGGAQRWADAEAFRQTLLEAAALAARMGDGEALVRAALANNRGGASRAGAVDEARVDVLERALVAVGTRDTAEHANLLATLALELSQGGDWEQRLTLADQAVACARRLGDEVTLVRVLLRTTEATRLPSTLNQRLSDTAELFVMARRVGDPVLLGLAALRDRAGEDRGRRVRAGDRGDRGARQRRAPRPLPAAKPSDPQCGTRAHRGRPAQSP